jgi:hypothetical protein
MMIEICRDVILPLILYGSETLSLTLREDHRLLLFENRVLREVFGCMRDEITDEWKILQNEEVYDVYSPNNIRVIKSRIRRLAEHVARTGGRTGAYRVFVGIPDGERPLGRPRCRWGVS